MVREGRFCTLNPVQSLVLGKVPGSWLRAELPDALFRRNSVMKTHRDRQVRWLLLWSFCLTSAYGTQTVDTGYGAHSCLCLWDSIPWLKMRYIPESGSNPWELPRDRRPGFQRYMLIVSHGGCPSAIMGSQCLLSPLNACSYRVIKFPVVQSLSVHSFLRKRIDQLTAYKKHPHILNKEFGRHSFIKAFKLVAHSKQFYHHQTWCHWTMQ